MAIRKPLIINNGQIEQINQPTDQIPTDSVEGLTDLENTVNSLSNDVMSGLVFSMDFDRGSSTTEIDKAFQGSTPNQEAVLIGGVQWNQDDNGVGIHLTGDDNLYADITPAKRNTDGLDSDWELDPFTIHVRIRPDTQDSAKRVIFSSSDTDADVGSLLWIQTDSIYFAFKGRNNAGISYTFTLGKYYDVAVRYTQDTGELFEFFVDGTKVGEAGSSGPVVSTSTGYDALIGKTADGLGFDAFDGIVQRVAIYNTAKSDLDIQAMCINRQHAFNPLSVSPNFSKIYSLASGSIPGGGLSVAQVNKVWYASHSSTYLIGEIDITDPVNSIQQNTLTVSDNTRAIEVDGDYLWAIIGDDIYVYDIRTQQTPVELTNFPLDNPTGDSYTRTLKRYGKLLLVGYGSQLDIYDVSDIMSPVLLSTIDEGGDVGPYAPIFDVENNILAVSWSNAFYTYDISDPTTPASLGYIGGGYPIAEKVVLKNNFVFLAGNGGGAADFFVIDLVDPTSPTDLVSIDDSDLIVDFVVAGKYVIFMNGFILDLTDLTTPIKSIGFIPASTTTSITMVGNIITVIESSGSYSAEIFKVVNGIDNLSAQIGSAKIGDLHVERRADFSGKVNTEELIVGRGGLHVGAADSAFEGNINVKEDAIVKGKIESATSIGMTGEYILPTTDGNSGDVMQTDGSGSVTFQPLTPPNVQMLYSEDTGATVANSVAATTLLTSGKGSVTIPANSLAVGDTLRFVFNGYFGTSIGNQNLTIDLYVGASLIWTGTMVNVLFPVGSAPLFSVNGSFTIQSIGAGGTIIGQMFITDSGANLWTNVNAAAVALDTTVNNNIDIQATWSVALAANTITSTVFTAEKIG